MVPRIDEMQLLGTKREGIKLAADPEVFAEGTILVAEDVTVADFVV